MPSSYSLPKLMEEEIEALIDAGYYSSKSDVVKDAIRELLEKNSNLRIAASVEMYRKGIASLGKAAEIAGMSLEKFKTVLKDRKIKIIAKASKSDIIESDKIMKKMK